MSAQELMNFSYNKKSKLKQKHRRPKTAFIFNKKENKRPGTAVNRYYKKQKFISNQFNKSMVIS